MQSPPGAETVIDGRRYLYFAGTGYLGLQGHPAVVAAARRRSSDMEFTRPRRGPAFGTSPPVAEVERRAAQFLGAEEALYLISGYAVNFAIAAAISPAVDLALIDEAAHDCLRESTRWLESLKRPPLVFRHRDAAHLDELLGENLQRGWRPLVMTDGLFPVSGQLAPLVDYLSLLQSHSGGMLLVDDAHGLATLGPKGRGSLELAGVSAGRDQSRSRRTG